MSLVRGCVATLAFLIAAGMAPAGAQTGQPGAAASGAVVQTRTAEFRDITFGATGEFRTTIGRLAFTGLTRGSGRVQAQRIDVEKIVVKHGSQTTEIPAIVILSADLPTPLFRALTEGDAGADWGGLAAQTAVEQISIENIIQRDTAAKVAVHQKGFALKGFKNGVIASARLGGITATAPTAPGAAAEVAFRMGEIRYQQIDVAEMVRFVFGGTGGSAKQLLQRAVIDGIEIKAPDAVIKIDRVELAGIAGRAPRQPLPAAARIQSGFDGPGDPAVRAQVMTYVSDLLRTARIDRYHIEGIKIEVPGQGRFAVNSVTLDGLSSRGLERFAIAGVDIPTPDFSVRFDRFELRGISYGALLDAALEAARSGAKPDFPPDKLILLRPYLTGLRLSRLDMQTPKGPVAIGDVRFELDEVAGATRSETTVTALKVDINRSKDNPGREKLMALGYGELVINAELRIRVIPQERALVIETVGLSVDNAGRVDATARLDNVDIVKVLADPDSAERLLGAALLGPIQLRLVDLGLAERFYADAAREAGVTPDAIRAGLAAEMRAKAIGNFGPMLQAGSADAIADFLRNSGTITARIAAAAGQPPVTINDIQRFGPPLLMERLRVTLEAAAQQ